MSAARTRSYALLGWFVWKLAKRRLRRAVRSDGEAPRRRRFMRIAGAVAVIGALAGLRAKRGGHDAAGERDEPRG